MKIWTFDRARGAFAAATLIVLAASAAMTGPAWALPSFGQQTGQPCGACHTDFPGLTPYGRLFKLQGYTASGGRYRTTPFSTATNSDEDRAWVPPISMMSVIGSTHTQTPLTPPTAPYSTNDNVVVSPLSFFWGGAITDHLGAFAQVTYAGQPAGGFGTDPFAHTSWTWDNTDVRYTDHARIAGMDVTLGITANNNPTVQDAWNTTPAWAFPYAASTLAPTPGAGTIIDGAFAAHVAGAGAYAWINNLVYLEATAYRTLGPSAQNDLGVDPFGAPGTFGAAPYWRAAVEPHWGNHWLELGTFGMAADVHPYMIPGTTSTATFPQGDKYVDVGLDSQYQYQGDNFWITVRGSYIHESQTLDASFVNGLSANPTNDLNEARAYASLAYGNDNRIVLTGQYFNTWGSPDAIVYGGNASGFSPNSDGWIAEIAYIPFMSGFAPGWPSFNTRLGLEYIWYNKFDGTTVGAQSNNTLFLYIWLAWGLGDPGTGTPVATDMPVKARPPRPFTWTSCYAGGQAAGGWGEKDLTDTVGLVAGLSGFSTASTGVSGYMLGGQLGCDYQFTSKWVLGVEGEASGGRIAGSTQVAQPLAIPGDNARFSDTTDFLSSATARAGYGWDRWLPYIKGGAAWAGDRYGVVGTFQGAPYNFAGLETRFGWVAGAGIEWALRDNWSVNLEYNYYGFGHRDVTFIDATAGNSGPEAISQSIQTLKLGVNFHALSGDLFNW
jgi:opacity protein-like surface antigen